VDGCRGRPGRWRLDSAIAAGGPSARPGEPPLVAPEWRCFALGCDSTGDYRLIAVAALLMVVIGCRSLGKALPALASSSDVVRVKVAVTLYSVAADPQSYITSCSLGVSPTAPQTALKA
jgi:hypothetical protein